MMPFPGDTNLLVGEEGGSVIFCHFCQSRARAAALIELERTFFPDLKEVPVTTLTAYPLLADYGNSIPCDPARHPVKFSRGTPFLKEVWRTLREIGVGQVISYKRLAERAGYTGAQQAVGQAMARNYLLLFVPCHRVVASDGGWGGFSAGLDKKIMLLKIEKFRL